MLNLPEQDFYLKLKNTFPTLDLIENPNTSNGFSSWQVQCQFSELRLVCETPTHPPTEGLHLATLSFLGTTPLTLSPANNQENLLLTIRLLILPYLKNLKYNSDSG